MHYSIDKNQISTMINSPGEIRGDVLLKDKLFVLSKGGEEKLKKTEEELEEMGYLFYYNKIAGRRFYPWSIRILSLLAISRVFNMNSNEVKEMGKLSYKRPFSSFAYFFPSIEKSAKVIGKDWRKKSTIGRVDVKTIDRKEKYLAVRLYNLHFHPIYCDYFLGYIEKVFETSKISMIESKEARCYFRGDDFFHEFLLKWKK